MFALIGAGEVRSVKIGRLRRVSVEALNDYVNRISATAEAPTDLMAIFIGRRPEAGFTRVPNEWARDPKPPPKPRAC